MTAREILRAARDADRQIEEAEERAERMRARLEAGRMSALTGMPRGGGTDWTATADALMELEQALNARTRAMCAVKRRALAIIDSVAEARRREALELHYLDGLTWEDVAERMGIGVRQAQRLHAEALEAARGPEDENA